MTKRNIAETLINSTATLIQLQTCQRARFSELCTYYNFLAAGEKYHEAQEADPMGILRMMAEFKSLGDCGYRF